MITQLLESFTKKKLITKKQVWNNFQWMSCSGSKTSAMAAPSRYPRFTIIKDGKHEFSITGLNFMTYNGYD
jgi:hypothetical protein